MRFSKRMPKSITSPMPFRSRRQFLAGCSAVTLAAAAAPTSVLGLPFLRGKESLDSIGFGHFATHLGTTFRVWQNGVGAGDLALVEARPQPANLPGALEAPDAHNERFSLVFEGPADLPLEQNTYLFDHAALGRFLMFIVPVFSPRSPRAYYEAIFNRPFAQRHRREF